MFNRIVTEPASVIRTQARFSLRNNWIKGVIGVMLYYILTIGVANILDEAIGTTITIVNPLIDQAGVEVGVFGYLYDIFTTPIFIYGMLSFIMVLAVKMQAKVELLFDGFGIYFKVIGLTLVMGFKILMWSLLFVVPGIIAAINYSMSFFVLIEDPSKGIMECINESIRLMRGNKMNLIFFALSYIGWFFAGYIGMVIIAIPLSYISDNGYVVTILSMVVTVPFAFALLYYYVGMARFYQLTKPVEGEYREVHF